MKTYSFKEGGVQLYAHQECWLFRENHPEEFQSFGCGPGGTGDLLVPDTMFGVDISNACRIHDWYYRFWPGKTEEDRAMADRIMRNNLLRIVRAKSNNRFSLWLRERNCQLYYNMVRNYGASAFFDERNPEECLREI